MVTSSRLSSVPACPPQLEGWTPLANFTLARINEKAPQILAKGLPQGSLCQKTESSSISYYVHGSKSAFVELLLMPAKRSFLDAPQSSDDELSQAITLITERRHPDAAAAQALSMLDKSPPPTVSSDEVGLAWVVVDSTLTPQLVTLLRHELNDAENNLFRHARVGDAYYVTTDTEQLGRIIAVAQEVKRDLSVVGLHDAAMGVNAVAVQLTYIQTHHHNSQPFWKKSFHELWPLGVAAVFTGWGVGYLFHAGGDGWVATKKLVAKLFDNDKGPKDPPPSAGASGPDDRVDAGEAADFQIDSKRDYEALQHVHVNGTAVAAVIVIGGIVFLLPELVPVLAGVSPEAASLATGLGAFAASH
jgi:hypothetical protein